MSDVEAYDFANALAIEYISKTDDAPTAAIAKRVDLSGLSRHPKRTGRMASRSERLLELRRLAFAEPFDRQAFNNKAVGFEECAEKRYLMSVAAVRASSNGMAPESAAADIMDAIRLDPGNAEYVRFAEALLDRLPDNALREQIDGELNLIRRMRSTGVAERGMWR